MITFKDFKEIDESAIYYSDKSHECYFSLFFVQVRGILVARKMATGMWKQCPPLSMLRALYHNAPNPRNDHHNSPLHHLQTLNSIWHSRAISQRWPHSSKPRTLLLCSQTFVCCTFERALCRWHQRSWVDQSNCGFQQRCRQRRHCNRSRLDQTNPTNCLVLLCHRCCTTDRRRGWHYSETGRRRGWRYSDRKSQINNSIL